MKFLKTQKAQNIMLLAIAGLVLVMFADSYLSAKNNEENYLINKLP